ncbi:hypothetical protein [Staphylococcus arlettae]|uniref:hypothetical protein n=1 Tax=Staphylococcus arlettae TaxID=29378 RepID=UPI0011A6A8C9|nr:hypothetical protein [Staphylococcus arlettae]MBF0737398.1 hypothetical protein [Staphylococcus arlettae]
MFLLIVASIHLYLMKRLKTTSPTNNSSHNGTAYQSKRAMLGPLYWKTAQHMYQRLTTYIFRKVFVIALPLTLIDIWLFINYRNGIILIIEVIIYLLLLIIIYRLIERKLKQLQ